MNTVQIDIPKIRIKRTKPVQSSSAPQPTSAAAISLCKGQTTCSRCGKLTTSSRLNAIPKSAHFIFCHLVTRVLNKQPACGFTADGLCVPRGENTAGLTLTAQACDARDVSLFCLQFSLFLIRGRVC